jgi:hypothetical protein
MTNTTQRPTCMSARELVFPSRLRKMVCCPPWRVGFTQAATVAPFLKVKAG